MKLLDRLRRIVSREQEAAAPVERVAIVTDSTADIPGEIASDLGISVVPLQVIFGTDTFRDGVDLTSDEFFARLAAAKALPSTSQPSAGTFQQTYEALASSASHIVSIHLSSHFSGTIEAARQAAAALSDRCQIDVVDSGSVSMAMGLAVIAAARAARSGANAATCTEAARSVLRRERVAIAVDTLEYLRRGGRIGRAQAFLGGLLNLKPILTIRDGKAHPLARVRTRKKALEEIVRICLADGDIEEAAVMHSASLDDAERVADAVRSRFPEVPVHVGSMGPVIGVHGGPGVVGLVVVLRDAASGTQGMP